MFCVQQRRSEDGKQSGRSRSRGSRRSEASHSQICEMCRRMFNQHIESHYTGLLIRYPIVDESRTTSFIICSFFRYKMQTTCVTERGDFDSNEQLSRKMGHSL
jgi:hypothetical protein